MALLLANLSRRTPEELICLSWQFWHDSTTQNVWWDLDSVFQHLRLFCSKKQKHNHWINVLQSRARKDIEDEPPFCQVARKEAPAHVLNKCICTTKALHTFIFVTFNECKFEAEASVMKNTYAGLLRHAVSAIRAADDGMVNVGISALQIDSGSQVTGFLQCLSTLHKTVRQMFVADWGLQHAEGLVSSSIERETLSLMDVANFVMIFEKRRRHSGKAISPLCAAFLQTVRRSLVAWTTKLVDRWVLEKYLDDQAAADRAPPATSFRREGKRKYTKVSAEAAWELIKKVRQIHDVSLRQALLLDADREGLGCSPFNDSVWIHKLLVMYYNRSSLPFTVGGGINHYCFVADPGSHSYKDCLVSLVWSWEAQLGVYPVWQQLVPGKVVLEGEANMDDSMLQFFNTKKLERVAAYRQMQGLSHQLYHLTNKRHRLDLFQLPRDCHVRPVEQGESRRTVSDASGDHVYIRNLETGEEKRVLPAGLLKVKMALLQLDQGSIGCAGVAFFEYFLGWLITAKFDKIHRCIRDLKGAGQAVPIFVKTKLWSSYLFSLNKRPFGSGAHGTAKTRLVETFRAHVDIHSPVFIKYLPRLATQWQMPMETEDERQQIYDRVCMMPSFRKHMAHPKLQNWFAWNRSAHEQLDEFFGTKCIFESELDQQADPEEERFSMSPSTDVRAELQRILKGGGGIPLAYRLMKDGLYQHIKALWYCEKATWDWYTAEVLECKTPGDALAYSIRNVDWGREKHLYNTLYNACVHEEYMEDMQMPFGNSKIGTDVLQFAWRLVGRRSWSLTKHSCPPESYARILQVGSPEIQRQTAEKLKREHLNFLKLEADRHTVPAANDLWKDIIFLLSRPVRILFEFFKRDRYSPDSPAGQDVLRGFLITMESNKSVEDIHQPIRMAAAANQNKKLSKQTIQDLIVHSGSLEARSVHHGATVTKQEFLQEFATTPTHKNTASMHQCVKHKLPVECSRMMKPGQRPWPALTEDSQNKAAAAWSWLHMYFELRGRGVNVSIGSGRLSKLVQPATIVRRVSDQATFAAFGNALWAWLGMPLVRLEINGQMYSKFQRAPVQFLHVFDVSDWQVLPFLPIRLPGHGLVMEDAGGPVNLMLHTLREGHHLLTAPDIERCCKHSKIPVQPGIGIEEGLQILGKFFQPHNGPSEACHFLKKFYIRKSADDDLLKDPLVEAVFDDLDPDDKDEFKSMQEARKKKNYKRALAEEEDGDPAGAPAPQKKRRKLPVRLPAGKRRARAARPARAAPPEAVPLPDIAPLPEAGPPEAAAPPEAEAPPVADPAPVQAGPAAAEGGPAGLNRMPNVLPYPLAWENMNCPLCGKVSGQKKYHPAPGLRDKASWFMRCYDFTTGTWPSKLPGYRCRTEVAMAGNPGDVIKQWVLENRSCCA